MEVEVCPACNNPAGEYIGTLGKLHWFKCRACGWEFVGEADLAELEDEEEENVSCE